MYVAIFIVLTCPGIAQEKEALSSDLLRVKIEQFEKTDITSKSATVQSIYQRTLLRLYNQFNTALNQDIADLKAMQATISGASTESQTEIEQQLQKLLRERTVTVEKIRTLIGDVRSTATPEPPASEQVSSVVFKPAQARTATLNTTSQLSASLTPERANNSTSYAVSDVPVFSSIQPVNDNVAAAPQVTGRVTVINEQFFTNADEFTPDQLRRAVQKVVSARSQRTTPPPDEKDVPDIVVEETGEVVRGHGVTNNPAQLPALGKLRVKRKHVGGLGTPLAEVDVKVEKPDDSAFHKEFKTDYQGNYTTAPLADGYYVFSVKVGDFKTSIPVHIVAGVVTPNPANLQLLVRPLGEFSRAIVGFEQAGASAAKSNQKYFFDLTLSHPLPFQKSVDPYFGPRGRMWGTVRVTSVPQQITSSVGTFATEFVQQASAVKVNEVAQAVEFLAGVDVRLTNKYLPFGSFGGQTATKLTLSFIAGGGATTPFNPRETLEIFRAFPGAPGLPTLPTGTEFVAFVSPDRDRFFRQYYAGFRLQTHYFDYRNPSIPLNRYPATLDITYGQNEAITGGRLRGGVIRLEAFYPLPYEELKFINLFGTALIRPIRTKITDPLILQPAPADTVVPSANVLLITVPQINRDYYRVGVGIDFISFIKKLGAGQTK
jgi:hypothetical protein